MSEKFNPWRRKAIEDLLTPPDSAGTLEERQTALRGALRIRNESFSNDYLRLALIRRHQQILVLIGASGLLAVLILLALNSSHLQNASQGRPWVLFASALMGIVGATTSAAQRSTQVPKTRIPQQLASYVAAFSRVPIGAVAGLLAWLGAQTEAAPTGARVAFLLIGAFGAGFAERLVAVRDHGS